LTTPQPAPAPQAAGGFGDLLGQVLGGARNPAPSRRGGLGAALDELSQMSRPGGGRPAPAPRTKTRKSAPAPKSRTSGSGGSFGDLLDDVLSGRAPRQPEPEEQTLARVLIRAMLQAAKSDRRIDRDEKKRILNALG